MSSPYDDPKPGPCPCGRTDPKGRVLAHDRCCGRYLDHLDATPAPDAESLMRSRYSAFVLENARYLLATWHPSQRPPQLEFEPGVRWLGLQVRSHTRQDDAHAQVEFVARLRDAGGRASRLHEKSRFLRERDQAGAWRWYYLDAAGG